MNFGMISYEGLTEDSFVFPEVEQPFLPGTKNPLPKMYIGLSKWTYKQELKISSKQVPQYGTLPYYSTLFNSVEMNNTHYAIPSKDQVEKWYNSVGSDFQFCPKFNKQISHSGTLGLHKLGITNEFINSVKGFKEKLGTSFLLMRESTNTDAKDEVIKYLQKLPQDFELAIEVRHETWFANQDWLEGFVKELNSINKGFIICDTPGRRDAVHMHLSNPTAFIRFVCQGDEVLDMFRIEQWRKQLKSWFLQGLEKCYFFLHIHNEDVQDEFIKYVQSELVF